VGWWHVGIMGFDMLSRCEKGKEQGRLNRGITTVAFQLRTLNHNFIAAPPSSHLSTASLFTMSLLTHEGRLTVKAFASVPALADLPEIQQQPGSVSNVSSLPAPSTTRINLAEGCILTKSVKYTHQLTHWVNGVHSGDSSEVVSRS
jgi:hypothetical protein